MAGITIGNVAGGRRATTTLKYLGGGLLAAGWVAVVANRFDLLGEPLPIEELAIALSLLIVASLLVGVFHILRGPGFYRALRVGEVIGEERARRACPWTGD